MSFFFFAFVLIKKQVDSNEIFETSLKIPMNGLKKNQHCLFLQTCFLKL